MRKIHANRTFLALMLLGVFSAWAIGTVAIKATISGLSSSATQGIDVRCLFLPTRTDLGTHLLSYALMGIIFLGTSSGLVTWHTQWKKTKTLVKNLISVSTIGRKLDAVASRLALSEKTYLVDSERTFCFCEGILSPRIYLSKAVLDGLTCEELEALLFHEKYHLENRDPLKVLLGKSVASALFFVPLLKELYMRYLLYKEIAADDRALQEQGGPMGLAAALTKLISEGARTPTRESSVGAVSAINERIDHLLGRDQDYRPRIPAWYSITSLIVVVLLVSALFLPFRSSHPIVTSGGSHTSNCVMVETSL